MTSSDHNYEQSPVPGAPDPASRPPVRLAQAISEWARAHLTPAAAAALNSDHPASVSPDQPGPQAGAS